MAKLNLSIKIYIMLVVILAVLAGFSVFMPQGNILPLEKMPAAPWVLALVNAAAMLILYGGLGFIGLKLARKIGFADIWDFKVSNKQRFLIPIIAGVLLGLFLIIVDSFVGNINPLGHFKHPPFPTSLVASATAGIGEEIIFRLFFISFFTWMVSSVLFKGKWLNKVFWIAAIFSALLFALGHIPSLMILYGLKSISEIPAVFIGEIILLNGVVSIFAAYYFRKFGFLAAVGIHFWTDIVWHAIWGLF